MKPRSFGIAERLGEFRTGELQLLCGFGEYGVAGGAVCVLYLGHNSAH